MASSIPNDTTVFEDSGFRWMARVTGSDGNDVQQSDIDSISYSVYDLGDTSSPTATGTLDVLDVVFDTLQTDSRWSKDSTGYNFGWNVPSSVFAEGNKTYRIEVKFTPFDGEAFHLVRDVPTVTLLGS